MKKFEIRRKLENHLMKNGGKKTSEKILLQSLKELQKKSKKYSKNLVKIAFTNITPIFKLSKIENKKQRKKNRKVKEVPLFIAQNSSRTSLAIKLLLNSTLKKKEKGIHNRLNKEILLNVQGKGEAIQLKDNLQKQVLLNKRYFYFYKWR